MSKMMSLEQMMEFYGRDAFPIPHAQLSALERSGHENDRDLAHLLRACNEYAAGRSSDAADYLARLRFSSRTLSIPVIAQLIWVLRKTGRSQDAAYACLDYAEDAAAQSLHNLALEACGAAVLLDQESGFEITRSPAALLRIAAVYERAAATLPSRAHAPLSPARPRLALVTGNLVDHVVAYSRLTLQLARLAAESRFDVKVYSTENLARREAPLFPFGLENDGSEARAPRTLAALRELGIPVWLAPRDLPPVETAALVMDQMLHDGMDIAVFQTGMASPIDWLVARNTPLPIKAAIHIGTSTFNRGLHLTLYDNPANLERETPWWSDEFGERRVLCSGVDIEAIRSAPRLDRSELGIPPDAVIIGTLSNRLGERLSDDYVSLMARVLSRHPSAWFVGIGNPPPPERLKAFAEAGVVDRIRFPGPVSRSACALKMLDIYASEFPVGGSESVKEAMACGIPVVALRWSDAHAESAAAHLVGAPPAIPIRDPAAYEELLNRWIACREERLETGSALRLRAGERYSLRHYADELFNLLESLLQSRKLT